MENLQNTETKYNGSYEKSAADDIEMKENGVVSPLLNYHSVKKAALILRAVNHSLRQKLIELIDKEKKITVTEIYVKLRLEQSVASQHLAILRKAGVLKTARDGKFIFYTVNYDRLQHIDRTVQDLLK